jgi:hypothetical protein
MRPPRFYLRCKDGRGYGLRWASATPLTSPALYRGSDPCPLPSVGGVSTFLFDGDALGTEWPNRTDHGSPCTLSALAERRG